MKSNELIGYDETAIAAAVEAYRASPQMRDRTALQIAVERVYDRLTDADVYALAIVEHCMVVARGPKRPGPKLWDARIDHQGVRDITCISAKEADELLKCVTADLDPVLADVFAYVLGCPTGDRTRVISPTQLARNLRPEATSKERMAYLEGLTVALIKFARMRIKGFMRWRGRDYATRLANAVEDRLDRIIQTEIGAARSISESEPAGEVAQ